MTWLFEFWNRLTTAWRPRSQGVGGGRGAGMYVDANTALTNPTVWTCVRIISETIATMGWGIFRTKDDGSNEKITGGAVDWILNMQANPEMSAFTWRVTALVHLLLSGNHYSEIERDNVGRPLWIWPIPPENVQPMRRDDGALFYRVVNTGRTVDIEPANMLHVAGMGWDGTCGFSVLTMAARSIGTALAMDEYAASFYANGVQPGPIIKHPKALSEPARANLQKSLDARRGAGQSFKALLLEEGMQLETPAMTMVDAQFLESRKLQVADICRWFRVQPHKAQDLERSTNNNIEHQSIEFVQDTILPWCRRLEQEVDIKLFGRQARGTIRTRLNIDTLLRGDITSRYAAFEKGRNGGWLNADEIRAMEKMNPIPDGAGKIFLQPMNFVPLGTEPQPAPVAAAPGANPAEPNDPAAPAPTAPTAPKALVLAKILEMSDYAAPIAKRKANA